MIPFQVTLQDRAVEVFSHCEITSFEVKANIVHINVRYLDHKDMKFLLIGKNPVKEFTRRFKIGDSVNIVSEGGVIRRISKGIDVEV